MKSEHDRYKDTTDDALTKWKNIAHQLELDKQELQNKLEDERR